MTSRIRRLLSFCYFFVVILCSLSLFLGSVARFINPIDHQIPALFGLAFPFLFLVNVILLIPWAITKNKKMAIPLLSLVFALFTSHSIFAVNLSSSSDAINKLKVLSFNVRNFDLYNWTDNKKTRNEIFSFLRKEQSDIMCIQEFFNSTSASDDFITLDSIVNFPQAKYYHDEYTITLHQSQNWGIATFSAHPIVNKGNLHIDDEGNNICIYSDIKIDEDTLRVYNMHLASIKFQKRDYQFIDSISQKGNQAQIDGSIQLIQKLQRAFKKRAEQVALIKKSINSSPYPVIVCGDMNDTPTSFAYHELASSLNDAFLESGNGIGQTYIGSFPSYRIDYIFHDPVIKSSAYQTHQVSISDHLPISCSVAW